MESKLVNPETVRKYPNGALKLFAFTAIGLWLIGIVELSLSVYSDGSVSKLSAHFIFGGFLLYFYSKDELGILKKCNISQPYFVAGLCISLLMAVWLMIAEYI